MIDSTRCCDSRNQAPNRKGDPMNNLRAAIATVLRIALPFFRSDQRWTAIGLLAAVIGLQLFSVWIDVRYSQWNNTFYTAIQKKDWATFAHQLFVVFTWIAVLAIVTSVYQTYLQQWLQIRWRAWMTQRYSARWMANGTHYRMRIAGNAADNPDQRIAEDTDRFTGTTLAIVVQLLGQIVSFFSFLFILWMLTSGKPLIFFGERYYIPGFLVWAALAYAVVGTWIAHKVGQPLVGINFLRQRYDADFRFALVRLRENAEEVALLKGEPAEREVLDLRFRNVIQNFYRLMGRTKTLNFYQVTYNQIAIVFPFIVLGPLYFAGIMELGDLTQAAYAFGVVQTALSFFVSNYDSLASWKSVVDRLDGFEKAVGAAEAQESAGPRLVDDAAGKTLAIADLAVGLPDGRTIVTVPKLAIEPGEHALVTGPSGSGKTTLFRALSGVWPFGSGTVSIPAGTKLMILPQRAYLPLGTLRAALAYPEDADTVTHERAEAVLRAVGLGAFVPEMDEAHHWQNRLSGGEQQRVGIARAILQKPDWLLLDEATAALDEKAEEQVHLLLRESLPDTAIISIGHRASLSEYHEKGYAVRADGSGGSRLEAVPAGETV
jgi:putative ATP-binding cassette transporter